nr:hypothetical protein [Tanacetum cinerariifolium]
MTRVEREHLDLTDSNMKEHPKVMNISKLQKVRPKGRWFHQWDEFYVQLRKYNGGICFAHAPGFENAGKESGSFVESMERVLSLGSRDTKNQIDDLSTHTTRYISLSLTQKFFANMRRVGKGFSGVETPLFEGMLAAREIEEEGIAEEQVPADDAVIAAVQVTVVEDVDNEAIPSTPTLLTSPPPPSHDIPSTSHVQSSPPQQPQTSPQAPPQGAEFPTHLFQQVLDTCFALTRRVENLKHDKAAQKLEIIKLQARVKKLERANKVKSSKLRRLKKVGTSQRIESSDDMEDVFNQGRMIDELDKDEGIELIIDQAMFEKPDGQDAVWKNQRSVHGQALAKSWKLLTSCGVHIISLIATQLILLVERRYPLSKFTLEQLVNVTKLQVEEESEMSLELLRFTRQQLQEYQQG